MKKILYMLMLSAAVSCGTVRQMHSDQNITEQEAVDLGYGQVSRNNLAFSVSEAKMNEAVENVYMDIFDFLRNNIPGVVVSQTEMAGDVPHIEVRGNRSIFGTQGEPLPFGWKRISQHTGPSSGTDPFSAGTGRSVRISVWITRSEWRHNVQVKGCL